MIDEDVLSDPFFTHNAEIDLDLEIPVGLPPLYNDDLDAFQFRDIFRGDSETDLDDFFTDLFSTPSFPRASTSDIPTATAPPLQQLTSNFYTDADVLQCYYRSLHPVFPILPPPTEEMMQERPRTSAYTASYEPASPLILALLSVLTHLPHQGHNSTLAEGAQIIDNYSSNYFARQAMDAIQAQSTSNGPHIRNTATEYHRNVPKDLEVLLACCVMSLYHYLCRGDIDEMTFLAQGAFERMKDFSPRFTMPNMDARFAEAFQRAWWMTYLSICNASILSCRPPMETIDINKVAIPYPRIDNDSKAWEQIARAEETLVAGTLLLVALVKGFKSTAAIPSFYQNIRLLDDVIRHQLSKISAEKMDGVFRERSPESHLEITFRTTARIRLLSARIKLHRYRALMNHPRILKRFEATPPLRSIGSHGVDNMGSESIRKIQKSMEMFPLTAQESGAICLESAMGISDELERLVALGIPIAPCFCSALLAGYTLLMFYHFEEFPSRANGCSAVDEEIQKGCEVGIRSTVRVLETFSAGFSYVIAVKDQLKIAATACDIAV
nr:uncharacterized protein CTRU02_13998 [Colletotrichum truncatum]KAF6782679.1 hypothetical protein CTRU02_13998 [Colletotrichum truncatum]